LREEEEKLNKENQILTDLQKEIFANTEDDTTAM
jgi:hypothetical protein